MSEPLAPLLEPVAPMSGWTRISVQTNLPAYGDDAYGVGIFSPIDPTRFLWTRVKQALSIVLLALLMPLQAKSSDSFTPSLGLTLPAVGMVDPVTPWGAKLNNNFNIIDVATCDKRVGCTIQGPLTVNGQLSAASGGISLSTASISTITVQGGAYFGTTPAISTITSVGVLQLAAPLAYLYGGTGGSATVLDGIPYAGSSSFSYLPLMGAGGIIIGTGVAPSTGTIQGTPTQIAVTNSPGEIVLSFPTGISVATMTGTSWIAAGSTVTSNPSIVLISTKGATVLSDMSTTEKNLLTTAPGAIVYDHTLSRYSYYSNQDSSWVTLSTTSGGGGGAGANPLAVVSASTYTYMACSTDYYNTETSTSIYYENASCSANTTNTVIGGSTAPFSVAMWPNSGVLFQFAVGQSTNAVTGNIPSINPRDSITSRWLVAGSTIALSPAPYSFSTYGTSAQNPGYSCYDIYQLSGQTAATGTYWVVGYGAIRSPGNAVNVYCDMNGGWTLVVGISASNDNQFTTAAVTPGNLTSISGLGRYSDAFINSLTSGVDSGYKLICAATTGYYRTGCTLATTTTASGSCIGNSATNAGTYAGTGNSTNVTALEEGDSSPSVNQTFTASGGQNGCKTAGPTWGNAGTLWKK